MVRVGWAGPRPASRSVLPEIPVYPTVAVAPTSGTDDAATDPPPVAGRIALHALPDRGDRVIAAVAASGACATRLDRLDERWIGPPTRYERVCIVLADRSPYRSPHNEGEGGSR